MQRVGEFEKVSFEQFRDAMKDEFYRGQELPPAIEDDLKKMWEEIALPSRATTGSAGYDFKAPFTFEMRPGETMKIPTGIRVKIDEGWWLGCLPRSGLGFKFRMQFDNTMGVIDSDYYFSDNEGHIFAKITNDSKSQKIVHVEAGNGFMQAIFIPYGITYSDDATGVRNGGMGAPGTQGAREAHKKWGYGLHGQQGVRGTTHERLIFERSWIVRCTRRSFYRSKADWRD